MSDVMGGSPDHLHDGPQPVLAAQLTLPRVEYRACTTSTMDMAHALAEQGAPAGTLAVAGVQLAGRGRSGKSWTSEEDAGLWCTLLERPSDPRALAVLALRVGLALAETLAPLVDGDIQLKWPNDLLVNGRKLAGILIEVRWRDGLPEWAAIGVGINRRVPPTLPQVAHVRSSVTRDALLTAVVPALRRAAARRGPLGHDECAAWEVRDALRGREVDAPVAGEVRGISPDGAVLIVDATGAVHAVRSGSLVPASRAPGSAEGI